MQNDLAKVECGSERHIRSLAIADMNGLQYIFCGSSDGILLYSMLTVIDSAEDDFNRIFQELEKPLQKKNSDMESTASNHNAMITERRLRVITSDIVSLRIGGSEVSLHVGRFFGPELPIACNHIDVLSDSVLAHTSENSVLLFKNGKQIQASSVHGAAKPLISIARLLIYTLMHKHNLQIFGHSDLNFLFYNLSV